MSPRRSALLQNESTPLLAPAPISNTTLPGALLFSDTSDPSEKRYGTEVASSISGEIVAISAPSADVELEGRNYLDAGLVYIYKQNTAGDYELAQRIQLPGAQMQEQAYFGESIAISENTLAIGAPEYSADGSIRSGAVFVYNWNPGVERWELATRIDSGFGPGGLFGASVALHQNRLLIGAPFVNHSGYARTGAAELYERSHDAGPWLWKKRIEERATAAGDRYFASSVTLSASFAAIGAPGESNYLGRVYGYPIQNASLAEQAIVLQSSASSTRRFGWSVAAHSSALLVGAPGFGYPATTEGSGEAHAFAYQSQNLGFGATQRLLPGNLRSGELFGFSVAMHPYYGAVGSYRVLQGSPVPGAIDIYFSYPPLPWAAPVHAEANAPNSAADLKGFGASLALSNQSIFVGAPATQSGTAFRGAALKYDIDHLFALPAPLMGALGLGLSGIGLFCLGLRRKPRQPPSELT